MLLNHGKLAPAQLRPSFSLSASSANAVNPNGSSQIYVHATQSARRFFRSDAPLAIACGYPGIDWSAELADLFAGLEVDTRPVAGLRLVQVRPADVPEEPVAVVRLAEGFDPADLAHALDEMIESARSEVTIDLSLLRGYTPDFEILRELLEAGRCHLDCRFMVRPLHVPLSPSAQAPWMVRPSQCNYLHLIGGLSLDQGVFSVSPGLLYCRPKVLVLPAAQLLADPQLVRTLLEIGASGMLEMQQPLTGPLQRRVCRVLPVPCHTRFVITGERYEIAALQENYGELANPQLPYWLFEPLLTVAGNEPLLGGYLQDKCRRQGITKVEDAALNHMATALSRLAENRHQVLLDSLYLNELLRAVKPMLSDEDGLTTAALKDHQKERDAELSSLRELTLDSIMQELLYIETAGMAVGQVNGLSVVAIGGHPTEFGEPIRITAAAHYGDGELSDIERKADLGGNLHAKGMMLVQSFLQQQFGYHHPLPLSFSLAFEQSYQETEGDSASLAALCAILSAMVKQPLSQSLAITGAVDHFGRVLAVGGINEKVEGFFKLCQRRGLDGSHGVILPASNVQQLNLTDEVIEAVEQGHFTLYSVENTLEALTLLMKELSSEQILKLIDSTLHSLSEEHHEDSHHGVLKRFTRLLRPG